MYPTIPHMRGTPLSVDDAAELAISQFSGLESAVVQLGRDPRPDLVVLAPLGAQLGGRGAPDLVGVGAGGAVEAARYRARACGKGSSAMGTAYPVTGLLTK